MLRLKKKQRNVGHLLRVDNQKGVFKRMHELSRLTNKIYYFCPHLVRRCSSLTHYQNKTYISTKAVSSYTMPANG